MTLRRLHYFVTVADEMSFTAAARTLSMAQPPLSTQIRSLEDELGAELFRRLPRGIALTAAGEVVLPAARRLLDEYAQLAPAARRAAEGSTGRLAVGLVPSAANGALPGILQRLRRRLPDLDVTLVEERPPELVRLLQAARLDVVLVYAAPAGPEFASRPVAEDRLVVALPPGHPLGRRRRVPLSALDGEPLILPTRHGGDGLYERIMALLTANGIKPEVVQGDVWMMQTMVGLVSAGIGLAIVPASTAVVRSDSVDYRPLAGPTEPLHLNAVWRAGGQSPTVGQFLAECEAT